MSFEWNLSSDEEDFEGWGSEQPAKNLEEPASIVTPPPFASLATADATVLDDKSAGASESEDEDSVDWEDADEENDRKPAAETETLGLQAVQINLNEKEEPAKKQSRKRKRRTKFRVQSLPGELQYLLWNLNRSHLLSLTSNVVYVSSKCVTEEILAIAHSLIPARFITGLKCDAYHSPTIEELQGFLSWYFDFVHGVRSRRERQRQRNRAAGAPSTRKSRPEFDVDESQSLLAYAAYLSSSNDEDPQLARQQYFDEKLKAELLIAMARSMGWRTRYVVALNPLRPDLVVEHPLLAVVSNLFTGLSRKQSKKQKPSISESGPAQIDKETAPVVNHFGWIEILCFDPLKAKNQHRWVHVDPTYKLIDSPGEVELLLHQCSERPETSAIKKKTNKGKKRAVISYALAVEHCYGGIGEGHFRLTDVTPRYAESWVRSLRRRGVLQSKNSSVDDSYRKSWWFKTIKKINEYNKPGGRQSENSGATIEEAIVLDEDEEEPHAIFKEHNEIEELKAAGENEAIPTSKAAFQTHPVYVIPSVLGKSEVLAPDADKRVCGVFKGQLVYRRSDVSTALTAKKWLYEGRKVLSKELVKPVKTVKARKKAAPRNFKPLKTYGVGKSNDGSEEQRIRETTVEEEDDGMEKLYAKWQTKPWCPPPIGPQDEIPVNEYKNVELAFLNPGLTHIDQRGVAKVAKKLGIPYAPCLLGFEGHGGNRTPTVRGIVVHDHNAQLIREAGVEVSNHTMQQEYEDRRKKILLLWKKLMVGLVTQERLEREYGNGDEKVEK